MCDLDLRTRITRAPNLAGIAPRVATLYSAWQQAHDAYCSAPDEALHPQEAEWRFCDAIRDAGLRVAALHPQTLQEAASLLACVFLDEATEEAFGLFVDEQVTVLANVKAFLAAHVAAMPERSL